jgi:peptide/nickel transport system substrate-binding protein
VRIEARDSIRASSGLRGARVSGWTSTPPPRGCEEATVTSITTHRQAPLRRRLVAVALVLACAGVSLAACGSNAASTPKKGGTILFAEGPGANPNYIFPYLGCAFFSVSNTNQFQELMYRPLYWFGLGRSTAVQYPISLASAPKFSNGNKTITIDMKGWKFSNGQVVNAESLMFFLNMYRADPKSYCGYNAGYGIPDQLASATGSGNTVTLTFTTSVNPGWILYNYLSELTPMPEAWDKTSLSATAGSGHCATGAYGASSTNTACKAVEAFLDGESTQSSTYTNALWQVVDGPWRLTSFDQLGNATFVPNAKYSGEPKPLVSKVELLAYTSTTAEQNDLYAGKLTIGFVDPNTLPGNAPTPGTVGPNINQLKGSYNLMTGSPWSFNYAPWNFSSQDPKSAEVSQLYIREALQEAVNQQGIITAVDKGYGWPTCSPVPPNSPKSISENVPCAYKYSPSSALSVLAGHGWKIEGGVQTCVKPGTSSSECGAGIAKGATLTFSIIYASGSPSLTTTMNTEISEWKNIGVVFTSSTGTFNNVTAQCDGGSFQVCMWGAGWIYAPDYYPSGETLFTPKGGFNPGSYSNATMTALIEHTTFGTAPLTGYATYAAQQLPVLYEPNPTATIEVSVKLKGQVAPNPLQNFMPEYMYF